MPSFSVIRDPDIIEGYLVDASNTRGTAEALVRPRHPEEAAELMAWCQERALPLTITARRTATTGAPVPQGGWLLSTELLNRIHGPDDVDAGVILGEYQTEVEARGDFFPPDPTSRHECSIGAAIACNASGARSFRYGPTRGWIRELQVILPTGELMWCDETTPLPTGWLAPRWTEPLVKTAAGYSPRPGLLHLLIGHEGTLGLITRARVRLLPLPRGVLSLMAFFSDTAAMLTMVSRARRGAQRAVGGLEGAVPDDALSPRAIEYFDAHALNMVRARVPDIPADARHALFVEVEHDGEPPLEQWWEALEDAGALMDDIIVAEDDAGRHRLQAVRHAIPAGVNEKVVANGMPKVGTDFAVPDLALPEMLAAYEAVEMDHICFGHIGDNHLHLNFLPTDATELAAAKAQYRALALRAVALGGTVSAEHGIGKLKRELLAQMVGADVMAGFRQLKASADPAWILGRGTLLDAPPHPSRPR